LRLYEPFPSVLRGFLAFWVVGSMGSAIIFLAYDLFRRFVRPSSPRPVEPDLQRRDFLKKGVSVAAATPFLISGYGVLLGRHRFQVEHFDLPLNGLSPALSQLSIVHLTDIHVGPFMPEEELDAYVEAANRLEPDVIALTGDFISSSLDEIAPCVNALARLKARYGIFACMGNHDVFAHADDELTRLFSQTGVRVLRNDAIPVRVGNTTLNILGIDDLRWGKPDLARALKVAQKEPGEVRLLLSHRPEVFPDAARKGLDVVLSGHYHGGQVKLGPDPESISIARLITPYAEGLFHLSRRVRPSGADSKDAVLFVSRGIGITGLPIRVNCPPQIAHLTLKKA
jgi:predicted MPP superfamily phosphohydrolase